MKTAILAIKNLYLWRYSFVLSAYVLIIVLLHINVKKILNKLKQMFITMFQAERKTQKFYKKNYIQSRNIFILVDDLLVNLISCKLYEDNFGF